MTAEPGRAAEPTLSVAAPPGQPRAVALVLHGGRSKSTGPVRPNQLTVLRMIPFARSLRGHGASGGLVVARLRYRVRGWNGPAQSPVADVRWALAELAGRFPGAPVVLVGHSMGGRAALYAADGPSVAGVVALAPWLERDDPVQPVAGRRVLLAHGSSDRTTDPAASAEFARAAAGIAASVSYVRVSGDGHAMLRRAALWHGLATGFTLAVALHQPPSATMDPSTASVLAQALAGEPALVV
jgi:pimeloyl-ACP methyl ester carboxylesterase